MDEKPIVMNPILGVTDAAEDDDFATPRPEQPDATLEQIEEIAREPKVRVPMPPIEAKDDGA